MPLIKRISIGLLLIVISLYFSLPFITRFVLASSLEKNNIELIDIELSLPSYQQIIGQTYMVGSASIKLADKTEIHISDILLLTNRRSNKPIEVSIGTIKVSSQNTTKVDNKSAEPVNLQAFLPRSFTGSLPQLKLSIASIETVLLPIKLTKIRTLLSKNQIITTARITPVETTEANSPYVKLFDKSISLNVSANNKIEFKLADEITNTLLSVDISLSEIQAELHGTLEIQHAFKQLNIPLNQGKNISLNKGNSSLTAEFSLPLQQILALGDLESLLINAKFQQQSILSQQQLAPASSLSASVNVEASLNKGEWQTSLDSKAAPLAYLEGGFKFLNDSKQGTLKLNINEPIVLEGTTQANTFNITQGSLQFSYSEGKNTLADIQLSKLSSQNGTKNSAEFLGHFNINKPTQRFPVQGLSVVSAKANLTGRLAWYKNTITFDTKLSNRLSLKNLTFDDKKVKNLSFSLPPQAIKLDLKASKIPALSFLIDAKKLSSQDTLLDKVEVDSTVALDGNNFQLNSKIQATSANIAGKNHHIPEILLEGIFQHKNNLSKATLNLFNACHQPLISASWNGSATTKDSYLNLQWQHDFSTENTLQHWLNTSALPFNINSGSLSGFAQVKFEKKQTLLTQLIFSLKDINGSHQVGLFKGIQFKLNSHLLANKQPQFKLNAFIEEADIGLKISNIKLKSTLSKNLNNWHANIPVVTAQVFSGSIGLVEKELALTDDIKLNVYLNQVNLADLVATQQVNSLDITGKVSGQIPIHYQAGEINILDGSIRTNQAGNIRYSSPLSGSNDINQQLKLTLDILEDFDYSKLTSQISYNNRILKLGSSILGTNYNAVSRRPVELNLNTVIDLQGMIKALRLQSGLESQIEKLFDLKTTSANNERYCK